MAALDLIRLPSRVARDAIVKFAADGTKPENSPGLDFFNTGVDLITDKPAAGIESLDSATGLSQCWG